MTPFGNVFNFNEPVADRSRSHLVSAQDKGFYKIFLSHSGLDATLATSLAASMKTELGLEIFNTSEAEYRYNEIARSSSSSDGDQPSTYEDLRDYLSRNLSEAAVYLLLVTPRSLKANSEWIEFEMEVAMKLTDAGRQNFFVPCVTEGVSWDQLPFIAARFQGIHLDWRAKDLQKLFLEIRKILEGQKRLRELNQPKAKSSTLRKLARGCSSWFK